MTTIATIKPYQLPFKYLFWSEYIIESIARRLGRVSVSKMSIARRLGIVKFWTIYNPNHSWHVTTNALLCMVTLCQYSFYFPAPILLPFSNPNWWIPLPFIYPHCPSHIQGWEFSADPRKSADLGLQEPILWNMQIRWDNLRGGVLGFKLCTDVAQTRTWYQKKDLFERNTLI